MAATLMVGVDRTTVVPLVADPIVVMPRPLTMPCPTCGADALWQWERPASSYGTDYPSVDCPVCDGAGP